MSEVFQPEKVFAGRYRIQRFLAKGGFGAVYVAEQIETELQVALKVLWPHILQSEDALEKFKLEARISARLNSDNIVRAYDAGVDAETKMPFLVMELLDGETLQDVVERSGPLPADAVVRYLVDVARALDRAHSYVDRNGEQRPIVHRDLKPENLFRCQRQEGAPMIKVLDFGLAKVLSESKSVSLELSGTPLYMAYEQAAGERITPQTDVWSLGLVAFFLLTGRSYWKAGNTDGGSITQLFGEVLSLPLDAPSQRAAALGASVALSPGFDAWFLRCVNRDPAQRFERAGACVAELKAALGLTGSGGPNLDAYAMTVAAGTLPTDTPSALTQASPVGTTSVGAAAVARHHVTARPSSRRAGWAATAIALATALTVAAVRMHRPSSALATDTSTHPVARPTEVPLAPPPPSIASSGPAVSNALPTASASGSSALPIPSVITHPVPSSVRTVTHPSGRSRQDDVFPPHIY